MATEVRETVANAAIHPSPRGVARWSVVSNPESARAVSRLVRDQNRAPAGLAPVRELDARTDGIVGTSGALQAVLARARKVGPTDATVLVTGESGTGKELVARAIHTWLAPRRRPVRRVNCAAIPRSL